MSAVVVPRRQAVSVTHCVSLPMFVPGGTCERLSNLSRNTVLRNFTDMDLRLLRIFSIVVKCGGFTAAQAELNMSQSNISTHISGLEKRLGYRICERGKGGFRLTEKGQRILKASSVLFGAMDAFRNEAQDLAGLLVGDLYLGLADNIATLPTSRIDAAIARFYQREHDMHLHIFVNSPIEL